MKLFTFIFLLFFALVADLGYESVIKILFFSALSFWIYLRFFSKLSKNVSLKLSFRFFTYFFWLLKEIFVSAISIIGIVLFKKAKSIHPVIKTVKSKGSNVEDVIYSNSITVTPGTLTMKMEDGNLKVHSISKKHHKDLIDGEMLSKIKRSQG